MRKSKKLLLILLIPLILIIIFTIMIVRYNSNSVSGEGWFLIQDYYIDQLKIIAGDLDNITTLYLDGSITYDDYMVHTEAIAKEFQILKACRKKDTDNLDIKEGSHTYASKSGIESMEKTYDLMEKLISVCNTPEIVSNPNNLSYQYITGQEAIRKTMDEYIEAKSYYYPEILEEETNKTSEQEDTEKENQTTESNSNKNGGK